MQGRLTDATSTTVRVNGVIATVNGLFFTAVGVPIVEGRNHLAITAVDAATNTTDAELLLIGKDITPPAPPMIFPVISPTRLTFQTIEGRAEPGARVTIAGGVSPVTIQAAFGTGIFAASVDISAGANSLSITATDAGANVSSAVTLSLVSNPNMAPPPPG